MTYLKYLGFGIGVVGGSVIGSVLSRMFPTFTLGVIFPLMILLLAGMVTLEITGKMNEWAWSDDWLP